MNILTFDTSLDSMYVTFSQHGEVLWSKIVGNDGEKYHSAYLIPTIIELLKETSLTMKDVNAIGVNIGPGSFTGIRAGVTVARVVGQTLNIPVIGVPSLEIIALMNDTDKNTLCLMDARKNKAYAALYSNNGEIITHPHALELEEALKIAEENDYYTITDTKMFKLLESEGIKSINYQQSEFNFGINLAKLSHKYITSAKEGEYNWYKAKPLYIQPPPISMPKKIGA